MGEEKRQRGGVVIADQKKSRKIPKLGGNLDGLVGVTEDLGMGQVSGRSLRECKACDPGARGGSPNLGKVWL